MAQLRAHKLGQLLSPPCQTLQGWTWDLWRVSVKEGLADSRTQDEDGDVHGVATLRPLWSPCAKHEEEVAGEEGEA